VNKAQRVIILIGALIIAFMWFYPPWIYTYEGHASEFTQWAGYYPLFLRPMHYGMRLDLPLLSLQCFGVAVVVSGLLLFLRRPQHS
jgi:hypothetical protein